MTSKQESSLKLTMALALLVAVLVLVAPTTVAQELGAETDEEDVEAYLETYGAGKGTAATAGDTVIGGAAGSAAGKVVGKAAGWAAKKAGPAVGNVFTSAEKMMASKTGAAGVGKISHFKSDPSFINKAKELRTGPSGTDVHVSSYDEAHALMREAFPKGLTKVPGAGPNTKPISQSDDLFTKGTYRTDFLRDPSTNRIYGATEGSPHATNPHINIMTPKGMKVNIIIDDLGK